MTSRIKFAFIVLATLTLVCAAPLFAQQKGQWVPGQFGLNAGVIPDPGFTYANLALSYSADQLNNANGNRIPGITGTYSFWVDENIFYCVPKYKFLGGYFMPYVALNYATGSLVADITLGEHNLGGAGGGSGFADMYVQSLNLGWHLKRADVNVGYAFTAPTGRFTQGASDNVGSWILGKQHNEWYNVLHHQEQGNQREPVD
jgi:hypothetical protein